MHLYARVNILDGKAVRLPRGDVSNAIFLDADPVARARGWVTKGADRLHVVDLDAAAFGDYRNRDLIRDLIGKMDVPVQVGGGVRSRQEVDRLLAAGADKVVMGTVAIIDQVLFWDLCRDHPGRIVVSLDVRPDEELVIRGWTESSGKYLEEALIELSSAGAAGFMVAEVGRDALEEPPNVDALRRTLSIVDEPVIAAGGVRHLADLRELVALDVGGKRLGGVVVGREVTAGRFTIEEAAAATLLRPGGLAPWSVDDLRAALDAYREAPDGGEGADKDVAKFLDWLEAT
jgi:phosphoribosylformimino-5-aminoimidazole carboxamide ribotide isomerase